MKTTAIVLASGMSRRMGNTNKLLLPVQSKPLILHVVEALIQSSVSEIICVVGYDKLKITSILPNHQKIKVIANNKFHLGMSTSIKSGVQKLSDGASGCFICLGDMPFLTPEDYSWLWKKVEKIWHPSLILVPVFQEQRGHPVFFGSDYLKDLVELPDNDAGAKKVVLNHAQKVEHLDFPNDHILLDIDNYQDFLPIK